MRLRGEFVRRAEVTEDLGDRKGRDVVDAGGRADREVRQGAALLMIFLPVDLFVGEWLALAAVGGTEADVACYFVTGALILAGIIVILPPMWIGIPALLPDRPTSDRLDFGLARAVLVALAVIPSRLTLEQRAEARLAPLRDAAAASALPEIGTGRPVGPIR
jgi:hypothetical protein